MYKWLKKGDFIAVFRGTRKGFGLARHTDYGYILYPIVYACYYFPRRSHKVETESCRLENLLVLKLFLIYPRIYLENTYVVTYKKYDINKICTHR